MMLTGFEGKEAMNALCHTSLHILLHRKDQSSVLMQLRHYVTFVCGNKLRMSLMMLTLPTMILLFLSQGTVLDI